MNELLEQIFKKNWNLFNLLSSDISQKYFICLPVLARNIKINVMPKDIN